MNNQPNQRPAILYCRVSTPGQEREGTSLESQEASCREYAAAHGYSVASVVRETGSAAELWERPLLTAVREQVKAGGPTGECAALIVHDLDRLARNPIHQAIVIEECARAGVALEIVLTPLDSSPEGMLIAYVRGYAAQIEREKIRERQIRGKRQRALNGRIHGSGPDLYGYRRDRDAGVRVIHEPEARVVREIYEWIADEGIGVAAVARRLNARGTPPPSAGKINYSDPDRQPHWGKGQILKLIRHPAYKGEAVAWRTRRITSQSERSGADFSREEQRVIRPEREWIRLPDGVTPALVSEELWQRAQDAIAERRARMQQRNAARFYLLRGLVWCGRCGRGMRTNVELWVSRAVRAGRVTREERPPVRASTYRCSSRETLSGACGGKRILAEPLETWVWERVAALIREPETTLAQRVARSDEDGASTGTAANSASGLRRERAQAAREVERADQRQADLMQRYTTSDGALPWEIVEREVARLEGEKQRWRQRVATLDARLAERQADAAEAVTTLERLAQLRPALDTLTPEQRRDVLEALDARIVGEGRAWRLHLAYPIEQGGEWVRGVEFTSPAVAD